LSDIGSSFKEKIMNEGYYTQSERRWGMQYYYYFKTFLPQIFITYLLSFKKKKNCLFRSVAFSLYGDETKYAKNLKQKNGKKL
jgi:hypothetical protein